jgi:hypothetical protein
VVEQHWSGVAPDTVEDDVEAVWGGVAQLVPPVGVPIVDGDVGAQGAGVGELALVAGKSDDPVFGVVGELYEQTAHATSCGRDGDRVACFDVSGSGETDGGSAVGEQRRRRLEVEPGRYAVKVGDESQGAGGVAAAAPDGADHLGTDPTRIDMVTDAGDDPAHTVSEHHRKRCCLTLDGAGPELGVDERNRRDCDCNGDLSGSRVGVRQLDRTQDVCRSRMVGDYGSHEQVLSSGEDASPVACAPPI